MFLCFYENDTNEVKGSYHEDCLEKKRTKKKTKKKQKKKHSLHIELGHGGWLLQKYEFCKMPSERNERRNIFQCLIIIGAFFADQVELTKHIPPIFLFFM